MHPIIIILLCALGTIVSAVVIREIRLTLKPLPESEPESELTLKQKWIKALRSGEYKQGIGRLKRVRDGVPEYCCLGVLGVICGLPEDEISEYGIVQNHVTNYPFILKAYSGPIRDGLDVRGILANLNDTYVPFTEIADWIEEKVTDEHMSFDCP